MATQAPKKTTKTTRKPVGQPPLAYYQRALARHVERNLPQSTLIAEALAFSYEQHLGYFRKSGEPYFDHPMAVAEILLRDFKVKDPQLISAALLHDVVEDVPSVSLLDIETKFGKTVAELVDGCTKLSLSRLGRAKQNDLTHSKIFMSASRHLGVLLIKLADRLHNMRTLASLPVSKRRRIALETLKVYAPIAAKLNIFPVKRHLYNLALTHLFPRKSKRILNVIRGLRNAPEIVEIHRRLGEAFSQLPVPASVRPRVKGLGPYYSQLRQTLDLENAENQVDFTLVIDDNATMHCYTALGIINSRFTPVPKSIRDYIANQKPNSYQSLHVRINNRGNDYLIKIRTRAMDIKANAGLNQTLDFKTPTHEAYLEELSDTLRNIAEYGGAGSRRKDLIQFSSGDELFVFTPKGDIHYLPRGSIVLDFAYKIHTALGDNCGGAVINGEQVRMTQVLQDGDTVKIIAADEALEADGDLEAKCVTPKARSAVNKLIQRQRQKAAEGIGKSLLLQELERNGLGPECLEDESVSLILKFLHIKDLSALFIRIGQDTLSSNAILYYLDHLKRPSGKRQPLPAEAKDDENRELRNHLYVSHFEKAVHKFSKCCNPYPGQPDVLAALSERGVAFHRRSCENIDKSNKLKFNKMVAIRWQRDEPWPYPLFFSVAVSGISLSDTIGKLAPVASRTSLYQIESVPGKRVGASSTKLSLTVGSFEDAVLFFECFAPGAVTILSYGRQKNDQP